jgi:hypothetical protein
MLYVAAIRNMYSVGPRVWPTDVISTDSQKSSHHRRSISVRVTAMKCHLKDMPRSNGVVKNLASYKTFQTRLRIQRLELKRLPIDRRPAAHFREDAPTTMQRNCVMGDVCCVMLTFFRSAFLETKLYRIAWRISLRMISPFPSHASEVYIRRSRHIRLLRVCKSTTR